MADNSQLHVDPAPIRTQHDEVQNEKEEKDKKKESQAVEKSSEGKQEFTDWAAI